MSRHGWRKDGNHHAIVRAFEQAGASVLDLSGVGGGCPDILIGLPAPGGAVDLLVEIKLPIGNRGGTAHSDLNQLQRAFHARWRGRRPLVVRTVEEVELLIDSLYNDSNMGSNVVALSAHDDSAP